METRAEVFHRLIADAGSTRDRLFLSAVWLFSSRGYDRVGIRELTASVGIKEATFYNHFAGKEALLREIFDYWTQINALTVLTEAEIAAAPDDPALMVGWIMEKFRSVTDNSVVHAILAIIRMEGFTDPTARRIALVSMYHVRRASTLAVLERLRRLGRIGPVDLESWVASYYYGLIGILDEYVLRELDGESIEPMVARVKAHMDLFIGLLRPN